MFCEISWKSILEYPREFLDWNSETIFQDGKQIPKDNEAAGKTTPKLKKKNKQIKKKKDVLQHWYGKVGIWQKCLLKWVEVLSPLDLG